MDILIIAGQGLLLSGHDLPPVAAIAEAEAWLQARGVGEWDVFEARPDMRPLRAHWGGPDVGFTGPDHPGARPVTVVHLPDALTARPESAP